MEQIFKHLAHPRCPFNKPQVILNTRGTELGSPDFLPKEATGINMWGSNDQQACKATLGSKSTALLALTGCLPARTPTLSIPPLPAIPPKCTHIALTCSNTPTWQLPTPCLAFAHPVLPSRHALPLH